MKKKIISLLVTFSVMLSAYAPIGSVARASDYSVDISYTEKDGVYYASGTYNYRTDSDDELMPIIAVYDSDGKLKNVTMREITPKTGTADEMEISGIKVDEGDTIKGMLWRKNDMSPLANVEEKRINKTEVTAEPTPTATPTASPDQTSSELHWDFEKFMDNSVTANSETNIEYDGMEIHLSSGDTITDGGIVWQGPAGNKSDSVTTVTNNRYIKYTASKNGTLTIKFKGNMWNSTSKAPRMYVSCGDSLDCTTKDANSAQIEPNQAATATKSDTDTVFKAEVSEGKTYYIWPYYYSNTTCKFTVSDIVFKEIQAEFSTRNIYGSNMLLQRDKPVYIDGKATKAVTALTAELIKENTNEIVQTKEAAVANQEWNVTFDAVSDYENTYKIVLSSDGAEDIVYKNVIFGDLYLFSGQSNMWKQVDYYRSIDSDAYGKDVIAKNATDKIRVMHTKGSGDYGTAVLQYDALNAQPWRDFSAYENVSDISAPAYTAAVKMHKETGVPIGLITNAYPGSYISSWFDSALAIDACNLGRNKNSNERNWYCGRIYPLRNLELSGIFWYQGCADAATTYHDNPYEYYSEMMPKLIDTYRDLFGNKKLPFYYVQLSRIGSTIIDENNPDTGAAGKMPIKRAQTDTYLALEDKTNVGIISTLDLYGNYDASGTANCRTDIHLGQKNIIGERMASYALADIYNKDVYSHGPMYKSSESKNGKIIVTFDVNGSLKVMDSAQYADSTGVQKISDGEFNPEVLNEFEVAGTDGVWYTATAQITADNQVTVYSDNVAVPVKVRYCGKDYPESPNLTDASEMPSYVFERTADNAEDVTKDDTTSTPTITPTVTPNIAATYKFDFGNSNPVDGYYAVTPDTVYDVSDTSGEFQYGFLGTTETSYEDDLLTYDCDSRAVDGFTLVKGQQIVLASGGEDSSSDADSDYITVPKNENYIPSSASDYEGRFPIRFSMKADRKSYYTVTVTLTNSSDTENACVSLFSEKRQVIAEDAVIKPKEKITFKFNVDIEDVVYKKFENNFADDMLNISVSGKNAAISSLIVEKHDKTDGKIKGNVSEGGVNDGTTLWVCSDSTGCDYGATVPFFALQSYGGVGQLLPKYMPENIAVSNQGEGGLATGDSAHFNNCMLKEGDYLYVEYGHNESGADSYKSNLEKYYTRAHASGAKLIVVSAINRKNNFKDGVWTSDFGGYITAAEEFVKEKIDAGADDIAFVDLNTLYVEWMNNETERILTVNPSLGAHGAISFYYRSVKGSKVDNTHINDAGADNGAYCFFNAAKKIVETADGGSEDKYIIAQAAVVRPLVEGMKTTIGNSNMKNVPYSVSDEIINAGGAPNIYWDTVPSDAFEYDNSIAVDSVKAETNDDGSVTISSIGIRVMNTVYTYAKAVVTVTDGENVTKYYTENNYDCTGDEPGAVLVNSGFILSDKNHNDVTVSDKTEMITVPAGAECTIRILSCDDNWIVGDNPTEYSAVYTVYPETSTIFDEDGSSVDGWSVLAGVDEHSETVCTDTDSSKYISIYSSGVSGTTKKNYGFYKPLDDNMISGKYRLSFKTRFSAGVIRFTLANSVGNASSPFGNKIYTLGINAGKIYMNNTDNVIYTVTDEDSTKAGKINADIWVNVDTIIDIDNGKIYVSVAGSDYSIFDMSEWLSNNPSTLPIKYFGIAGDNQGASTTADIKDIKIVKLQSNDVTRKISVSVNDTSYGSVTVDNEKISEKNIANGTSVTVKAIPADGYVFKNWTDKDGNSISESAEYTISKVYADTELSAVFEQMASGMKLWNFSIYGDGNEMSATQAQTEEYDGLNIYLQTDDTVTENGIVWQKTGATDKGQNPPTRYITYTPEKDGKLKVTFSGNAYNTSSKAPRMYIVPGTDTSCMEKDYSGANGICATATAANKSTVAETDVTAGNTYYIWSYYYKNANVQFTVSQISFEPSGE